jgi:hypothetical protein
MKNKKRGEKRLSKKKLKRALPFTIRMSENIKHGDPSAEKQGHKDELDVTSLDRLNQALYDPEGACIRMFTPNLIKGHTIVCTDRYRNEPFVTCQVLVLSDNMTVVEGPLFPQPRLIYWELSSEGYGRKTVYGFRVGYFAKELPPVTKNPTLEPKPVKYVFPHPNMRMQLQQEFPKSTWSLFG